MTASEHVGSYYAASANPAPERPELVGEVNCDVCVVGAGFSGISSALHLAEKGYKVVVVEAARVGWGASGRNGGQMVNGYSRDIDTIRARYGEDAARQLGEMSLEGGDIIRQRVATYGIDCDLKDTNFFAAFTRRQLRELERRQASWARLGHDGLELVAAGEVRNHVDTELYCGGLLDRRGGHVHPLNLVLGEAAAIESLGGVIYEGSPVTRVEPGDKPVVQTAKGKVTAEFLVLCGNAYLGKTVPQLAGKVMPVSSQVITTEVLGEALTGSLIPSDTCIEDCNYFLDYYRITGDKRLLFGGGSVYGGADPADIIAKLRPNLLRTFPQLEDAKIEFAWSGNFAMTVTRIPHLGRLGAKVYFSQGYSGHGVTTTHLAGRLVAEAIDNQAARFDAFAKLPHYSFPGGQAFRVPIVVIGSWYYRLREQLGV
jgi:gamma-glutamylputrescine oxidase